MNVVKTTCLENNLPTHIRENTDFPQQKPWQFLIAEANLEGCNNKNNNIYNNSNNSHPSYFWPANCKIHQ